MVWIVIEKAEREIASVAKYTPIASRGVTVIETPTSLARVISMADCAPAALLGEHLISLFIADAVCGFELASPGTQPLLFEVFLSPIRIIVWIFGAKDAAVRCVLDFARWIGAIEFPGSLIFPLAVSFLDPRQFNPTISRQLFCPAFLELSALEDKPLFLAE